MNRKNTPTFNEAIADALEAYQRQQAEIQRLREIVRASRKPATNTELAEILRSALKAEKGWAERARMALGEYELITCELCGTSFPSGGKRKKTCGRC